MYHICIRPTTFAIFHWQKGQNPYVNPHADFTQEEVLEPHRKLEELLSNVKSYTVHPPVGLKLPDIVFTANAGLSLPGLPVSVMVLPSMKYKQRQDELPFIRSICRDLMIRTVSLPSSVVFEGQAEAKWFHGGSLLVCGYGCRGSKAGFVALERILTRIYQSYGRPVPRLLVLPFESCNYYHLDVAMMEFDDRACIVHRAAFSPASLDLLRSALGPSNVHVLDTKDSFCLNAIVDGPRLLTHKVSPAIRDKLESITGRSVVQIDTTPFEESGGSVRCMVLDVHPPS